MRFLSMLLVICLLITTVPVCRAQQAPSATNLDSTTVRPPAAPAADSLAKTAPAETARAMPSSCANPGPRRWDRSRIIIVGCAAALLAVTGIVAIKASYWPGNK